MKKKKKKKKKKRKTNLVDERLIFSMSVLNITGSLATL
jgi:hypothetical protein